MVSPARSRKPRYRCIRPSKNVNRRRFITGNFRVSQPACLLFRTRKPWQAKRPRIMTREDVRHPWGSVSPASYSMTASAHCKELPPLIRKLAFDAIVPYFFGAAGAWKNVACGNGTALTTMSIGTLFLNKLITSRGYPACWPPAWERVERSGLPPEDLDELPESPDTWDWWVCALL